MTAPVNITINWAMTTTVTMQTMAMTANISLPPLPTATVVEMTMVMMPATMMGTRGGKSVSRFKRKEELGECSEGELRLDRDYLLTKKNIPKLPSSA